MMVKRGKDLKQEWEGFVTDGNEPAYYQLYAHYHKYFFYLGTKKGASSAKIGDCVHDLFLYVFENREKLAGIRDHHNYLVTTFLRALFKKQRFSAEDSEDLEVMTGLPVMPAPDQGMMARDTSEQVKLVLQHYIDELSVSQAQIIYEKFYLNLSYEEIASSHGITVRTAYNTVFKAVDKLRKHIGENKLASLVTAITTFSLFYFFFF